MADLLVNIFGYALLFLIGVAFLLIIMLPFKAISAFAALGRSEESSRNSAGNPLDDVQELFSCSKGRALEIYAERQNVFRHHSPSTIAQAHFLRIWTDDVYRRTFYDECSQGHLINFTDEIRSDEYEKEVGLDFFANGDYRKLKIGYVDSLQDPNVRFAVPYVQEFDGTIRRFYYFDVESRGIDVLLWEGYFQEPQFKTFRQIVEDMDGADWTPFVY